MPQAARPRAIIYIPPGVDPERWQRACLKHCTRRGYEVTALVIDEDGSKWTDVARMAGSGEAEVVVVFDIALLLADRIPRTEEVGIERTGELPRHRRPRLFRRS